MIVSIAGVLGGASLTQYVQRGGSGDFGSGDFKIESAIGKRIDTSSFTLMDTLPPSLAIPDRAECWIYDAADGAAVTDPPNAISAYNTYLNGAGHEVTSTNPANWTPRLFAGYVATPNFMVEGPQRYVTIDAQDYTVRLRTTVCNMAFQAGTSDQSIVQQLFARYRPDYDTTNVNAISGFGSMPAISFPVHTLEQMMERVIKVTRGYYRVDYYKRVWYGTQGLQTAPFNLSDVPDMASTFPAEELKYSPDGAGLVNRVWVVGQSFLSAVQSYQIPGGSAILNGTNYQFSLPGNPEKTGMTVTVNGVDQGTIGVVPGDGDLTNPSSFKFNVLIQHAPAIVAFKTAPPSGATVVVRGKFRYPLVQVVTNQSLINATNGVVFEAVVRDRRINDNTLAINVGNAYLQNQGTTLKGGSCVVWTRSKNGQLIGPGQVINIKNDALFSGLLKDASGNPTTTAVVIITQTTITLDEDTVQPYRVELSFADRHVSGGY